MFRKLNVGIELWRVGRDECFGAQPGLVRSAMIALKMELVVNEVKGFDNNLRSMYKP